MKFKKSVAAIAAAAMVMSNMALTPVSVYAAPVSVGTSISGSFSEAESGTGSINTQVLASWGNVIKATDYTKVVVTYSITDLGNASQIGICLNSGETNTNGCGWQSTYVNATEGASQKIEFDLSTLGDKSFEWVGLDVLGTSGEAFSGTITIDSYELVEVPRDPMIDFYSDVLKTDGSGQYEWAQANFVSNESPEMADADLTGVTKAVFRARALNLNHGWNNGQFYAQPYKGVGADGKDEGDWQTKSFGGEKSSVDVTLSDTGDFNIEVPFNVIDTNKFYQLGWGTSTGKGAFKLYGIDFYAGATKIGTWSVTGTWDGPKKAAVSDVVPDAVEVTADKTAVVGTPVALTAAVSNKNAEISVKYKLEWTVTKDGAATTDATIVPGENNTATLTATKAGEYYVVCAVKSEDGNTEYVSHSVSFIFTEAGVKPASVSVSADRDDTITNSYIILTANIKGAADATVNVPCDIVWTASSEDVTITPSEDGKTATVTSAKAGKYTVTCTVNAKGETETVIGTVDVTFKEPVKPEKVTVKADKTTVTAGTPVTISREISGSNGNTIIDVGYGIKWSVSPESGATIKEKGMGLIFNATEAGEYTVTCTVHAEGDQTVNYATGTVTVTVEAATNPFDLTVEKDDLYVGESTTASAKRDGEAISVKWTSSDEKIATVDENGVITAVAAGDVTITATPEDGSPRSVVITVVAATKEYMVTSFVNRLYNTLLGRDPDEHSADHKNDLLADKTACDVARNFVLSEEFLNMGLTNEEVVDKMYMTFLGRPADEAGKADWVNRLNNGCSYAHVFYGFTQCNEFAEICADYGIKVGTYEVESPRDVNCNLTAFVSRLYGKVLGRTYDVPGLDNHTAKYLKTGDIYSMAYDFIFSPEFTEKELTNEEFVEIMYQTFFNRPGDDCKADWIKLLDDGGSREDVLKGFVGSDECAELVASFKI